MRLRVIVTAILLVAACVVGAATLSKRTSVAAVDVSSCAAPEPPLGALPPAAPGWCDPLSAAVDTAIRSPDGWSDSFQSGAAHARMPGSYVVFENARASGHGLTSVYRTEHFAHNGHWMVDIAGHGAPAGVYEASAADFYSGPNNGGALMRPEAAFRFDDGQLTIEFDVSAGITAYGDRVWPEVVVTTAPAPSSRETNGWYAAGMFGGYPAVGCAFPSDRLSECRVYDAETITAWLSASASGGAAEVIGGTPAAEPQRSAWRLCGPADPDGACRDHFRLELARDSIRVVVNGVPYMEHRGLPLRSQLPAELLSSPVYVYFGSWAYLVDSSVARVHWGRIAINPAPAVMR